MPYYLMQWIILERLEPYEVKVSSTVLRRGRRSDPALLSDHKQPEEKQGESWRTSNIMPICIKKKKFRLVS